MKNLEKTILSGLLVLILSPFIAYGGAQFIPHYDGFKVTSGSMEPEIETGSLLFTRKMPADKIEVGNTITFQKTENTFTTHKVIQKHSEEGLTTFETQGIANDAPDAGNVTEDELTGKKMFSIPILGYVLAWASTPTGIITMIIIPGLVLIAIETKVLIRELKFK